MSEFCRNGWSAGLETELLVRYVAHEIGEVCRVFGHESARRARCLGPCASERCWAASKGSLSVAWDAQKMRPGS